jgi:hypothetical protein
MQLADHQAEHLFLLVGENPLHNYVAARTLLKPGGTLYFVYSDRTKNQKDSLLEELQKDSLKNFDYVDLGNDESKANVIRTRIEKKLDKIPPDKSIGLNYTGGTKAMAVHAYLTVQAHRNHAVFSYLDPRKLKMCIDRLDNSPIELDAPSLDMSLENLFNLHGLYLLKNFPPSSQPILPELAKEIAKIYQVSVQEKLDKKFKDWCGNPRAIDESEDWRSKCPELYDRLGKYIDFTSGEISSETKQAEFRAYSGKGDSLFRPWLEGFWLESYILQEILERWQNIGISAEKVMMSFNVTDRIDKISTKNKPKDAKFELDIAFIKNYQLFAITCTTQSKDSECKEKLFEGLLRARELGGDEARLALICCHDNPDAIQDEIKRFGFQDTKIKVFGREDLANIGDRIADWVTDIERDARNS